MSTMKENIDRDDWYTCIMVSLALAVGVIANYYYHGGRLVW